MSQIFQRLPHNYYTEVKVKCSESHDEVAIYFNFPCMYWNFANLKLPTLKMFPCIYQFSLDVMK